MSSVSGNVEGNWPSHIFLRVSRGSLKYAVGRALSAAPKEANGAKFSPAESFHISLSRQFYLRTFHIEPFLSELALALGATRSFQVRVGAGPFVLSNDTGDNHFVCLPVTDLTGALQRVVNSVSETLVHFRQPKYYDEPIFHVSIADTASAAAGGGAPQPTACKADNAKAEKGAASCSESDDDDDDDDDDDVEGDPQFNLMCATVYCNIGNRRFRFELSSAETTAPSSNKIRRKAFTELQP